MAAVNRALALATTAGHPFWASLCSQTVMVLPVPGNAAAGADDPAVAADGVPGAAEDAAGAGDAAGAAAEGAGPAGDVDGDAELGVEADGDAEDPLDPHALRVKAIADASANAPANLRFTPPPRDWSIPFVDWHRPIEQSIGSPNGHPNGAVGSPADA